MMCTDRAGRMALLLAAFAEVVLQELVAELPHSDIATRQG